MACQDLLDQCRARARHAEDEYGNAGGIARSHPALHHLAGEDGPDAVKSSQGLRLVIDNLLPLQPVARNEMAERRLFPPAVRVSLAKRKVQFDLILARQRCDIVGQSLHRREFRVAGLKPFGIGQPSVMHPPLWFEHNGGFKMPACLVKMAEFEQGAPKIVLRRGEIRFQRHRLLQACHGLRKTRGCDQHIAEIAEHFRAIRSDGQGAPIMGDRLLVPHQHLKSRADRVMSFGRVRSLREGFAQERYSPVEPTLSEVQMAQVVKRTKMPGIGFQDRFVKPLRPLRIALLVGRKRRLECPNRGGSGVTLVAAVPLSHAPSQQFAGCIPCAMIPRLGRSRRRRE